MANQISVNTGSGAGAQQVIVDSNGNITVTVSRSVIGTVANVASANYANFAGTVLTNAQPNITSVGTLSNLTVANTVTTNNLVVTGNFQVGNLVANSANYANFAGTAFAVAGANVSGTVANATFATTAGSANTANSATVANSANNVAGANVTGTVANATFATSAGSANTANSATVANSANSVAGANVSGTVANATFATTAGSANTANSATVANSANSVALANVSGAGNIASINLDGSSSNVLYGNGIFAPAAGGNTANANYANFAGNAFSVDGSNVVGAVANATFALDAGNANIANIAYSVDAANVSGLGNIATINLDGNVSNLLTGNGTFVAIPTGGANANYANFAGTVLTNAQPNITSVGTLTALDANTSTPIFVSSSNGNVEFRTVNTSNAAGRRVAFAYSNPTTNLGVTLGADEAGFGYFMANTAPGNVGTGNIRSYWQFLTNGDFRHTVGGSGNIIAKNIILGNVFTGQFNGNIVAGNGNIGGGNITALTSITSPNITANTGIFTGNAAGLTNIPGGNVTGTVANATYALGAGNANTANSATVANSANSVTLANVSGAGNIASINLDGNVSNLLTGNGTFVAIPTNVANANYANFAGEVTTSAQPNITSVGNLTALTVTGNLNANVANVNSISSASTLNFSTNGITSGVQFTGRNITLNGANTGGGDISSINLVNGALNWTLDNTLFGGGTPFGMNRYNTGFLEPLNYYTARGNFATPADVQVGDTAYAERVQVRYNGATDSIFNNDVIVRSISPSNNVAATYAISSTDDQANSVFQVNFGTSNIAGNITATGNISANTGNLTALTVTGNLTSNTITWSNAIIYNGNVAVNDKITVQADLPGAGAVRNLGIRGGNISNASASNTTSGGVFFNSGQSVSADTGNVFIARTGTVAAATGTANTANGSAFSGGFQLTPGAAIANNGNATSGALFLTTGAATANNGNAIVSNSILGSGVGNATSGNTLGGNFSIIGANARTNTSGNAQAGNLIIIGGNATSNNGSATSGNVSISTALANASGSGTATVGSITLEVGSPNGVSGNVRGNINIGTGGFANAVNIGATGTPVNVAGNLNVVGRVDSLRTFGEFTSNVTQTSNGANTTNYMTFNNTEDANGVSIVSSTQLTVARTGRYNLQFSAQLTHDTNATANIEIWLTKNGSAIANTNSRLSLAKDQPTIAAWNWLDNASTANTYYEIAWTSPDTNMEIIAYDTANTISGVAIPSIIATITPVGA